MNSRNWKALSLRILPGATFVVLWQLICGASRERAFYFATPLRILEVAVHDINDGSLWHNTAITGGEALSGFVLGNIVGTLIGACLWYWDRLAQISAPYLIGLGAVPVFALAPMTIIWFGVGIGAKVALAFLATVFLSALQFQKGAEQVDPLLVRRLRVFGANRRKLFRLLVLPSSLIWVLSAVRMTIGPALLGAFIGEFIAADSGLGYMIVKAGGLYDTARVIEGVIAIVATAGLLTALVNVLELRILRWRVPGVRKATSPEG